MDVIIGIDHGTTRTKAVVLGRDLDIRATCVVPLNRYTPRPGWVEQDPMEIIAIVKRVLVECLSVCDESHFHVAGAGLANQGETVVVWERKTGRPLAPALVWQDSRAVDICDRLRERGVEEEIHQRSGLRLDPYFSAPKIRWLLDHIPDGQTRAERGEILVGTTDAWILWVFSDGRTHVTDASTASRTLLFNIHTQDWDPFLMDLFGIPRNILPSIRPSMARDDPIEILVQSGEGYHSLHVLALAVDQQAALFGHGCHRPGMAKVTYGTGAFALMHTGIQPVLSRRGILTTVAWTHKSQAEYALEGGVYVAGALVQWLIDNLGVLTDPVESAEVAASVPDSGGIVVIPALSGLGAPWWDSRARGAIFGLNLASTRAHLVRAALEGIAHSVRDVVTTMTEEARLPLSRVRVDGGPSQNDVLMQIQADILGVPLEVSAETERTAFGIAAMAGLCLDWWDLEAVEQAFKARALFVPHISAAERGKRLCAWHHSLECARQWSRGWQC
jgi:glycerol kinase